MQEMEPMRHRLAQHGYADEWREAMKNRRSNNDSKQKCRLSTERRQQRRNSSKA